MSKKGKFLGGALLGLGLGFLFAPKSGKETRKDLMDEVSNLWDKVRELDADEVKEKIETKLKTIEKEIKSLDKEKVLGIAKDKCNDLKDKVDDLIETAKETGKPIVENAAKTVKQKLANVTKEVLKKLEDEDNSKA